MLQLLIFAIAKVLAYIFILMLGLWSWFQWRNWDFLQAARKLPCTVKALPILGHIHLLWFRSWEDTTKLALELFSMAAVSKGVYNICAWCGPLPIVMVHKLEDIQKFLVTCVPEKGHEIKYLKYAVGNGLLSAPYSVWKIKRRHISPMFHPHNMKQLMGVFNSNSRGLVEGLRDHEGHRLPLNVLEPCMEAALKSVYQLIFGTEVDVNLKRVVFKSMLKAIHNVTELYMKRIISPWLRVDFIFKFLYRKELKEINDGWKYFIDLPLKMCTNNRRQVSDGGPDLNEYDETTRKGYLTLTEVYSKLLKKYPQFTEEDWKKEMATLYGTGTDTVGLTVATCLVALGKHQHIQDRLYKEIELLVGPEDDVTVDHLRSMHYLNQVYKETLRWATIVPYIIRRTTEDLKLSDCTVPAGNSVALCLIGPLMDPSIYPNPRRFDPDRFSNSTSSNRHSFIPFGTGSRMCIGKTYADYLVKTMLVHVLRRYKVTTDMDIYNLKKVLAITLVSSEGYLIKLHSRNIKN